jgi:hypothetical protein|tara:strand:+ start:2312 stop:2872 length:561 start_codon:yes stop_codon:yes gene_type:complete
MKFLLGEKMSKINKKLLKSIVKECLVEILAEGLVQGHATPVEKKRSLKETVENTGRALGKKRIDPRLGRMNEVQQANLQKRGSYLDQVSFGQNNSNQSQEEPSQNRASKLISSVTKDPIMSEIFADTAASTLKRQGAAERGGSRGGGVSMPADEAARIVEASDPMELFGSSAGKWAEMAFAPKLNR